MKQSSYNVFTLSNGLRVALLPARSKVVYCGFAIHSGSRNDPATMPGLAHFVEHTIFKGTTRRKSWHIINRMELVGGELNAFTTKEDTFVYTIAPRRELSRSIELLGDIVRHPTFPHHELDKERIVVADEINLYKDTPFEQIYDDFEAILFRGHDLGRPILGDEASLRRMTSAVCLDYVRRQFRPERMVFFCMGQVSVDRLETLCRRYLDEPFASLEVKAAPSIEWTRPTSFIERREMTTHQSHTIIGGLAPSMHDPHRTEASLIMNCLGGSGMNSLLNVALRERNGWVYSIDASLTSLSDQGWWEIYFGSDPANAEKALQAVMRELKRFKERGLTPTALRAWVKQVKGQLEMSTENGENVFLHFGKQILHYGTYEEINSVYNRLDDITVMGLVDTANQLFDPSNVYTLIYEGVNDDEE